MWAKFLLSYLLLFLCWPIHEPSANESSRRNNPRGSIHFTGELNLVPEPHPRTSQSSRATTDRDKIVPITKNDVRNPTNPQSYTLPLTWDTGRLVVDAKVNDRMPIRFIVDTGTNMTIIPAKFASRLGFDNKDSLSIDIRGVGGVIEGRLIEVDSLRVGEAEVSNFDIVIVEDSLGETALLGADFFSRFRMEINFNRSQMVLQSGDGPYDGYPPEWWQEKFRLYHRLRRAYERRISQNRDHMRLFKASAEGRNPQLRFGRGVDPMRPLIDEINEYQKYLGILANKLSALRTRADSAALPLMFRQ